MPWKSCKVPLKIHLCRRVEHDLILPTLLGRCIFLLLRGSCSSLASSFLGIHRPCMICWHTLILIFCPPPPIFQSKPFGAGSSPHVLPQQVVGWEVEILVCVGGFYADSYRKIDPSSLCTVWVSGKAKSPSLLPSVVNLISGPIYSGGQWMPWFTWQHTSCWVSSKYLYHQRGEWSAIVTVMVVSSISFM